MIRRILFSLLVAGALLLTGCGAPGEAAATTPAPTVSTPPSESSGAATETPAPASTTSEPAFTPATTTEHTSAAPETETVPVETTADDPWQRLVNEWRTKTLPLEAGEDGRLITEFVEAYFAAFEDMPRDVVSFAYSDSAVLSYQSPQVARVRYGENGESDLQLTMPVRYALKLYKPWSWPNGGYEEGTGAYEGWLLCHHYFCFVLDGANRWRYDSMTTDPAFYVDWGQPWHAFE